MRYRNGFLIRFRARIVVLAAAALAIVVLAANAGVYAEDAGVAALTPSPTEEPLADVMASLTLYATADAYVDQANPSSNYGSTNHLYVARNASNNERWTLLNFDLSSIPAGATITAATLQLYTNITLASKEEDGGKGDPVAAAAYQISPRRIAGSTVGNPNLWWETGVTWSNQPTHLDADDTMSTIGGSNGWHNITVTGAVRKWVEQGAPRNGFLLRGDGTTVWFTVFNSREVGGTATGPRLVVEYTPTAATQTATPTSTHSPTPTSTRTPTSTPTRTATRTPVTTATPRIEGSCPGTLIIHADKDTWIDQTNPTATHGSETTLRASYFNGGFQNTWLGFPLSRDLIPAGQNIYSAEIRVGVELFGGDSSSSTDVWITDLTAGPWNEATLNWENAPYPYGSTMNTVTIWRANSVASMSVGHQVIQKWYLGGSPNFGFELMSMRELRFHSRESGSIHPPKLIITCGSASPTPPPTRPPTATPTVTPSPTAVPEPVDYQILAVEVTQGIAGMHGPGAPGTPPLGGALVAGKPTYVRVYVGIFDKQGAPINGGPATAYYPFVTLWATAGVPESKFGVPNMIHPIFKPTTIVTAGWQRSRAAQAYLFEMPSDWHYKPMTFEVRLTGAHEPPDKQHNNTYARQLNFSVRKSICAVWVPVRAVTGTPRYDFMFKDPDGALIQNRALTLLPIRTFYHYYMKDPVEEYNWLTFDYGPYELDGDEWKIVHTLWWTDQFSDDPDFCDDAGMRTHYIGMVKAGAGDHGFNGIGRIDGDQLAFSLRMTSPGEYMNAPVNTPWGGRSLAHELGHNYGLGHTGCDVEDDEPLYPYNNCTFAERKSDQRLDLYGFDRITMAPLPPPTPPVGKAGPGDLMSYASVRWISDWTWNYLFMTMHLGSLAGPRAASGPEVQASPVLILSSYGDLGDGVAGLDRVLVADPALLPAAKLAENLHAPGGTGSWAVRLLDRSDNTLNTYHFEPSVLYSDGGGKAWQFYGMVVPWPPEARGLQLLAEGEVKATQRASAHAPSVQLLSPAGGEAFNGDFTIRWNAVDQDRDTLHYAIQYSSDNGATWRVLRSEYPGTSFTADARTLAGSNGQSRVRVIASDGFLSGSATSAPFSVARHPPTVRILGPANGTIFPVGAAINLMAEAVDLEDGPLTGEALEWQVSGLSGVSLVGETETLIGLRPGVYLVAARARDSDGETGGATITIQVGYDAKMHLPLIVR